MEPLDSTAQAATQPARGRLYRWLRAVGVLRASVRASRELLHRYRVPAWRLSGAARASEKGLSLVFAGQRESKNYFAHLAFDGGYTEQFLGPMWIWNVWRRGIRLGSDLVVAQEWIAERGRRARGRGFCIPCWIGTETDVEQATRLCRTSENIKSDARRLKRHALTYTIVKDPAAIAEFYSSMYVPYVERTYGDRAMLTPWKEFAPDLERSELMLLWKNGEAIAGNLFVDAGDQRVLTRALGVKNGDPEYVKMGAAAALYYFEVAYLRQKGYRKIHYGASRPFLKDGVLSFKKKYGANVVDRDQRIFRVRVARYSESTRAFLRSNPFLSERAGCFYANFFVDRPADAESPKLRADVARYALTGTKATRIHVMENARGPLDTGGLPAEPALLELENGDKEQTQRGAA